MKSTIFFLLVHFSIFGDLEWEGSNGDQKKEKKTLQDPRHNFGVLYLGGFIIANRNLAYFISGGFIITMLTLECYSAHHFRIDSICRIRQQLDVNFQDVT